VAGAAAVAGAGLAEGAVAVAGAGVAAGATAVSVFGASAGFVAGAVATSAGFGSAAFAVALGSAGLASVACVLPGFTSAGFTSAGFTSADLAASGSAAVVSALKSPAVGGGTLAGSGRGIAASIASSAALERGVSCASAEVADTVRKLAATAIRTRSNPRRLFEQSRIITPPGWNRPGLLERFKSVFGFTVCAESAGLIDRLARLHATNADDTFAPLVQPAPCGATHDKLTPKHLISFELCVFATRHSLCLSPPRHGSKGSLMWLSRPRGLGGVARPRAGRRFVELAIQGRTADLEAPRDLRHLAAIMRNREADDLVLEIF